jgi:hypothetical protein
LRLLLCHLLLLLLLLLLLVLPSTETGTKCI